MFYNLKEQNLIFFSGDICVNGSVWTSVSNYSIQFKRFYLYDQIHWWRSKLYTSYL